MKRVNPVYFQENALCRLQHPGMLTGTFAVCVEICSMRGDHLIQAGLSGRWQYESELAEYPGGVYLIRVVAGDKMLVMHLKNQGMLLKNIESASIPLKEMVFLKACKTVG